MSAAIIAVEEEIVAYQESLTERLSRGRLPVIEALFYATQIATSLRDLHAQKLVYGAVSSQLILLTQAGASLRTNGYLLQLGDGRDDVAAFGAVLVEMLGKLEGSMALQIEIGRLAMQCQMEEPGIQQVLIALRLLGFRHRQSEMAAAQPVAAAYEQPAAAEPAWKDSVLQWAQLARQWKPIAGLAALVIWAK
jgi:hypothetical protein